jgi:SAM-dependent methyltransferase
MSDASGLSHAQGEGFGSAVQVSPYHYRDGYDSLERSLSHWYQIAEATSLGGRLLEIGVGSGIVSAVLRARGLDVVTVDFDSGLHPDIVGDVRDLPFDADTFDVAIACEVLEHIPWADLPSALNELRRVARKAIVVSVPSVGPAATLRASIPNGFQILRMMVRRRWSIRDGIWALSQAQAWQRRGGRITRMGAVPPFRTSPHIFDGEHHWVLEEGGLSAADFRALAHAAGLVVRRDYRPPEAPWHHFFVLGRETTDSSGFATP